MYGSTSGSGRSAADGTSVEFQGTSTTFDSALFHRLCDSITSNVFAVTKHAATLEKTLKTIGSSNDSKAVRESVHVLQVTANKTIATTTDQLRQINGMLQKRGPAGRGHEERMRVTRLTSDFQSVVQRYTDLQKQIVAKMKTTLLRPESMTGSTTDTDDQTANLLDAEAQKQAQLQLQEELEFEQGMLLEREEKIRQIESDILDVNTIMKELGTLVHEQGDTIDTIEGHIESAYTEVEAGRGELQKAATYQSKYRKRLFCLLGTGFIVLIIVIIILVTQLKS